MTRRVIIDSRMLWTAGRPALLRLARWLNVPFDPCECMCCHALLVESVRKRMDENAASL